MKDDPITPKTEKRGTGAFYIATIGLTIAITVTLILQRCLI